MLLSASTHLLSFVWIVVGLCCLGGGADKSEATTTTTPTTTTTTTTSTTTTTTTANNNSKSNPNTAPQDLSQAQNAAATVTNAAMVAPIQRLNVLIYNGPGASSNCLMQASHTLKALLAPTYAVGFISPAALLKEPWLEACALLVFPGGADLPYCAKLAGAAGGTRRISNYVRNGGRYLGLCAGGYFATARCEFEVGDPVLEVVGPRDLRFFPGTCRGAAFKGFDYASEKGARAARIKVNRGAFDNADDLPDLFHSYYNGGGAYVDAASKNGNLTEVLATYDEDIAVDGGDGKAAVIYSKVGDGQVVLTGPHPEFAAALMQPKPEIPGYDTLLQTLHHDTMPRLKFVAACLRKMGLKVNEELLEVPTLSELHLSAQNSSDVDELMAGFALLASGQHDDKTETTDARTSDGQGPDILHAEANTFRFYPSADAFARASTKPDVPDVASSADPGIQASPQHQSEHGSDSNSESTPISFDVVLHSDAYPTAIDTPAWNHSLYYASLDRYRAAEPRTKELRWGSPLLYGNVMTSTNMILERNPALASQLPTGFTVAATVQTSGRGRGNNVWVTPQGCLVMSTLVQHQQVIGGLDEDGTGSVQRHVGFLQTLAAIAVVEAVRTYDASPLYADLPVRVKWPNDIYARDPLWQPGSKGHDGNDRNDRHEYVKIGGVLSSCSYIPPNTTASTSSFSSSHTTVNSSAGSYRVVIGIGLNVANSSPTTSLDKLLEAAAKDRDRAAVNNPNVTENQQRNTTKVTPFASERLAARIVTRLEALYARFCAVGFSSDVADRYYALWLHSGQEIEVAGDVSVVPRLSSSAAAAARGVRGAVSAATAAVNGGAYDSGGRVMRARVEGITSDWGLLKVRELDADGRPTNRFWALQSDENSFDYWNGLIKRKI